MQDARAENISALEFDRVFNNVKHYYLAIAACCQVGDNAWLFVSQE
jgi:hypothetical protein